MPDIKIEKIAKPDETKSTLLKRIDELIHDVEQRAFELFQQRDADIGSAFDDWLNAEKQLLTCPHAELAETPQKIELAIELPGFEAGEIEVSALPDEIVVHAAHKASSKRTKADTVWSELEHRTLCRRIRLPQPITVDSAHGKLELGVLRIVADKAASPSIKQIGVA
jgi:HSP20 family molecular chaperone IbpA